MDVSRTSRMLCKVTLNPKLFGSILQGFGVWRVRLHLRIGRLEVCLLFFQHSEGNGLNCYIPHVAEMTSEPAVHRLR